MSAWEREGGSNTVINHVAFPNPAIIAVAASQNGTDYMSAATI